MVVALHLTIWSFKTRSGLESVPRCEPSVCVCVCVCVYVCARACVCVCVRVRARVIVIVDINIARLKSFEVIDLLNSQYDR